MVITATAETPAGQYVLRSTGRQVRADLTRQIGEEYEALTGRAFFSLEHDIDFTVRTTGEKWTVICSGALEVDESELLKK